MMQRVLAKPMKAYSLRKHSKWQWPEEEGLFKS